MRISLLPTDFLSKNYRSCKYSYLVCNTENAHRSSLKFCNFCPVSTPKMLTFQKRLVKFAITISFLKKSSSSYQDVRCKYGEAINSISQLFVTNAPKSSVLNTCVSKKSRPFPLTRSIIKYVHVQTQLSLYFRVILNL
jgi:hypothetical protein